MVIIPDEFRFPYRHALRLFLRRLACLTLKTLTQFEVIGQENIPASGPFTAVGNHFGYADPVAVAAYPWMATNNF